MLKTMTLIIMMTVSASVFAATVTEIEQRTEALRKQNAETAAEIARMEKEVEAARKAAVEAEKAYKAANSEYGGWNLGFLGEYGRSTNADIKRKYEAAKANRETVQRTQDELQKKVDELNRKKSELARSAERSQGDLAQANAAIATALQSQGLVTDFALLQAKVGSVDRTLDRMAAAYDKAILGAYLKDKMVGLMNSDAMCKSVARCSSKGSKISDKDLDAVFNGKGSSTSAPTETAPAAPATK
jgi:DNA repair exonuclease SbcCD ATPase subunit